MSFSLNETAALAKRATRGAGYPWGLTEEAAWAVRWLSAHRLDSTAALAGLLHLRFGKDLEAHRPHRTGSVWKGKGTLCPLATGAALSDFAQALRSERITIHALAEPLLILPFAAAAARRIRMPIMLQADGSCAVVDGNALELHDTFGELASVVQVSAGAMSFCPRKTCSRATPGSADWDLLNALAARSYAPATDASRRLGAGAGQTDND